MIMSYLAYKKPLPLDQIGPSLNDQMLPANAEQLDQQARIDEMFEMIDADFIQDETQENEEVKQSPP